MKVSEAFENIKAGYEDGRMAHAYLFVGAPRGEAGELASKVLGLLFCRNSRKPCGVCEGCRGAAEHSHADLAWVEPEKRSRAISIEQIRDLQRNIHQTSLSGGHKACVIFAADCLTPPAANAFLKTLEEPPPRNLILMLSDRPQAMLPTILSRCQRISLAADLIPLGKDVEKCLFELLALDLPNRGLAALARAEGVERLLKSMKKAAIEDEKAGVAESEAGVSEEVVEARASAKYREERTAVLQRIISWHRDLLVLSSGCGQDKIVNVDKADYLRKAAGNMSFSRAMKNVDSVELMNRRMNANVREGTALLDCFLQIEGC